MGRRGPGALPQVEKREQYVVSIQTHGSRGGRSAVLLTAKITSRSDVWPRLARMQRWPLRPEAKSRSALQSACNAGAQRYEAPCRKEKICRDAA